MSKLETFCQKYHIAYLALFGSVLTAQFTKTSDIDVLVRFSKNHTPHLLNMIRMESELSELFGYPVDLKTPNDLSSYFRDDVLTQAKILYGKPVSNIC